MRTLYGYFRVTKHDKYTRISCGGGFYPKSTKEIIEVDICCSFHFLHHKRTRILTWLPPMLADMAFPFISNFN